jgi:hypothetical protein
MSPCFHGRYEELYLFRLQSHLERLLNSMKLMHMSCPYSTGELATSYPRSLLYWRMARNWHLLLGFRRRKG